MRAVCFVLAAALEWPQVVDGVLTGAGLQVELACVDKVEGDAAGVAKAIELLKLRNLSDIEAGLQQLGVALEGVPAAVQACNATAPDVEKIATIVAKLKDPAFAKEQALVVGENLLLNGAAIGQEVIKADSDAKADQSLAFGTDVGTILAKVFAPKPTLGKPDWPKVLLGVLEGFAGLEGTEEQFCLSALEAEEQEMHNAVQLVMEKDAKDVLKGLEIIAQALEKTPQVLNDCKNATADEKAYAQKLEAALALMKHPLKFAYHVGKDILVNGKNILEELSAATSAYEASNWQAFGAGVGEALEKLLVGDMLLLATPSGCKGEWPQVLFGVLKGAGFNVEEQCVQDAIATGEDLAHAVELLAKKDKADIEAALKELEQALQVGPKALEACKASEEAVEALAAALKGLGSPEQIAIEVGKNILLNGIPIYHEVEAAVADHAAQKCEPMGEDIGEILQKVFLSKTIVV